ncbi:TPA: hypothetical protein ACG1JD_004195, partial [Citrobacter sedlakii]
GCFTFLQLLKDKNTLTQCGFLARRLSFSLTFLWSKNFYKITREKLYLRRFLPITRLDAPLGDFSLTARKTYVHAS